MTARRRTLWIAGTATAVLLLVVALVTMTLGTLWGNDTADPVAEPVGVGSPTPSQARDTTPSATPSVFPTPGSPGGPGPGSGTPPNQPAPPPRPAAPPTSQPPISQPPTARMVSLSAVQAGGTVPVEVGFRFSHQASPCSGSTCQVSVPKDTRVTVTATTGDPAYLVTLWEGCDYDLGNACTITVSDDTTVTATIARGFSLFVEVEGSGTVTVAPIPMNCTNTPCAKVYPPNTMLTITATPRPGHQFAGWKQGWDTVCGPTPTCRIQIHGDTAMRVAFQPLGTQQ